MQANIEAREEQMQANIEAREKEMQTKMEVLQQYVANKFDERPNINQTILKKGSK